MSYPYFYPLLHVSHYTTYIFTHFHNNITDNSIIWKIPSIIPPTVIWDISILYILTIPPTVYIFTFRLQLHSHSQGVILTSHFLTLNFNTLVALLTSYSWYLVPGTVAIFCCCHCTPTLFQVSLFLLHFIINIITIHFMINLKSLSFTTLSSFHSTNRRIYCTHSFSFCPSFAIFVIIKFFPIQFHPFTIVYLYFDSFIRTTLSSLSNCILSSAPTTSRCHRTSV